ncbi:hypothetical protein EYZ11_001253 [Aspergillus tanneri]|uniref:Zn(2)-C6 fungal-type domain-containing protein n=1 Tax=Aspergillus tanneri TaxID=1220188 RepID=A0A4S3JV12_9EURO|nr:uncharacterized protein ATNIH1004_007160 [Aspergillus tanneri]KAA8645741.1 hypothetical protein ATNIH1004_007160 [Aspergillus tanneri]THC99254.1 hypothetical protein EYZ11_001253 [Aspergillus tanneri]
MSTPLPSPPRIGVIVNQSVRRVACDQCHSQKLRCTKTDDSNTCVRCHRLNRTCVWSPPLRSGRPVRAVTEGGTGRSTGGEMRRKRTLAETLETTAPGDKSIPTVMTTSANTDATQGQRAPSHNLRQPIPSNDSVETSETPSMPSFFQEWNLSDIFSIPSPRSNQRDSPFSPVLWTPPDSVLPTTQFAGFVSAAATGPVSPCPEHNRSNRNVPPPARSSAAVPQSDSVQDITQDLSDLNLSLLSVHNSLQAEPWGDMFESPSAVIAKLTACDRGYSGVDLTRSYPLVEVFNGSQRFIELLKRANAYFTSTSAPSWSSSAPYFLSTQAPPRAYQSQGLPSDSDTSSSRSLENDMQSGMPPPPSTAPHRPCRGGRADLPTGLLICTIYARTIDLYTVLITQLSHFVHALSMLSASGGPEYRPQMHPVIPPLQWGAFQPANYSALQMLIVTQVISFLLAEIERSLGVDEWEQYVGRRDSWRGERTTGGSSYTEYQSSRHGGTRQWESADGDPETTSPRRGLVSPEMIDIVVQGNQGRMGGRSGKIAVLRRKVKRVKKELERSIYR